MARITKTANIGGVSIASSQTRTQEDERVVTITLPAGKSGTLTTRTDNDTGVITVASGHGITDTDTVGVYWDGGSRYGVDVTATSSTTISIDAGSGTNLPTASTAVTVALQSSHAVAFAGDSLEVIAIGCPRRCSVEFLNSSPTSLLRYDIPTSEGRLWVKTTDVTNPLASGTVATVKASNGSTTEATLQIGLLVSTD